MRLLIFAVILDASYDKDKRVFLSPDKLLPNKMNFILLELKKIIVRSSEQKNNVKLTSFGFFTIAKKSDVQDLLDSILKITYPYISQARKLTDMTQQLSSDSGPGLKFRLLPEALPLGYEDKTSVIVGFRANKNGKKTVLKVFVWKDATDVWYRHKNSMFYKPIISKCTPVDMEDAEEAGQLTLSATGRAREVWTVWLGDYSLTEEEHRGRPVYSDGGSPPGFLYSMEDETWGLSSTIGYSLPVMRSSFAATSPALCHHWQYRELEGSEYKPGDTITVTFNN